MHPVNRTLSMLAFVATAFALAPAAADAQQATSTCRDGTTSSVTGRGACTAHGGVDSKATAKATSRAMKAASKNAKPEVGAAATAGASVTCGDGTSSAAGRGACSHHGGVKMAAGATAAPAPAPTVAPMPTPAAVSNRAATPRTSARAADRTTASAGVAGSGAREDNNPAGAVAKCKDGMYSHARSHRGACGHHGGVAQWIA